MAVEDDIKTVNGLRAALHPKWFTELNIEILKHPELRKELDTILPQENYEPEVFYGTIAAYCGIVLEGAYQQEYLAEQLAKALLNKRAGIAIFDPTLNVTKISKEVLQ